ncbi:hypothetical protein ESCO_002705 [Escovopsis weberi]|uniref:Uncharacterized protein n=1 Tax=Escovopsis weberi TaxID=150374 RepID=A0A0M9VT03_ESCWE|nr:hypothetical protein ESCO_002705 [Escovopsis weberi]
MAIAAVRDVKRAFDEFSEDEISENDAISKDKHRRFETSLKRSALDDLGRRPAKRRRIEPTPRAILPLPLPLPLPEAHGEKEAKPLPEAHGEMEMEAKLLPEPERGSPSVLALGCLSVRVALQRVWRTITPWPAKNEIGDESGGKAKPQQPQQQQQLGGNCIETHHGKDTGMRDTQAERLRLPPRVLHGRPKPGEKEPQKNEPQKKESEKESRKKEPQKKESLKKGPRLSCVRPAQHGTRAGAYCPECTAEYARPACFVPERTHTAAWHNGMPVPRIWVTTPAGVMLPAERVGRWRSKQVSPEAWSRKRLWAGSGLLSPVWGRGGGARRRRVRGSA